MACLSLEHVKINHFQPCFSKSCRLNGTREIHFRPLVWYTLYLAILLSSAQFYIINLAYFSLQKKKHVNKDKRGHETEND